MGGEIRAIAAMAAFGGFAVWVAFVRARLGDVDLIMLREDTGLESHLPEGWGPPAEISQGGGGDAQAVPRHAETGHVARHDGTAL